jgi:hypothetical protein
LVGGWGYDGAALKEVPPMMPADYHTHEPSTPDLPVPRTRTRAPKVAVTGASIALTVVAVLVIVAAVLGVLIWLAA